MKGLYVSQQDVLGLFLQKPLHEVDVRELERTLATLGGHVAHIKKHCCEFWCAECHAKGWWEEDLFILQDAKRRVLQELLSRF